MLIAQLNGAPLASDVQDVGMVNGSRKKILKQQFRFD